MKISLNWLKDYLDIDGLLPKQIAEELTLSGSIVETIEHLGDDITNVVVGKVAAMKHHPNADKLWICQIDVGESSLLQIITGAQNVRPDDLVPVALDNATIAGGKKIRTGKLRGELSQGMLCSLSELGLTTHDFPYAIEDGIFILQETCAPGDDIKEVLGLSDTVFDFEITSNRPDCLSVLGIAREFAATFDLPFQAPFPSPETQGEDAAGLIQVEVKNPRLCPRYLARVVKNVKVEPSPLWMRKRLRASGVRPVNNIVDITNFVMLEYGQPMHAFDYEFIKGHKITVRTAADGEKITTLDSVDRVLDNQTLVIADEQRAIAVAGVMGAENSEITDDTVTVVFESAVFDAAAVRKTAKKLGMRTEASSRFEKGLDSQTSLEAIERACELVGMLHCGDVLPGVIDADYAGYVPRKLKLEPEKINALLGTDIPETEMKEYLTRLEFEFVGEDMIIPSFRNDIQIMADVAEEVARLYGYNNIPNQPLGGELAGGGLTKEQKLTRRINQTLIALGVSEISTYSFISPKFYDQIRMPADNALRRSVTILNPLGEDTSIMRTTIMPSMLNVLATNYNARNLSCCLFENAKIYLPHDDAYTLPEEENIVCIGMYGKAYDFFTLKGIVESLFDQLGIDAGEVEFKRVSDHPAYHPGQCAQMSYQGVNLGILGQIHPEVAKNFGIGMSVFEAEIPFAALNKLEVSANTYQPMPRFPATARDLAIVCDQEIPVAALAKIIKKRAGKLLENLELFDVYTGAPIPPGKKSVAYSFSLRSPERTLKDSEADEIVGRILTDLEKIGAYLRS